MKLLFENKKVEHSWNCSSVDCLLRDKENAKHCSVFFIATKDTTYCCENITNAAKMWSFDGQKSIDNVGRVG